MCLGVLTSDNALSTPVTPPASPSRLLKEGDNQWLNSEVSYNYKIN